MLNVYFVFNLHWCQLSFWISYSNFKIKALFASRVEHAKMSTWNPVDTITSSYFVASLPDYDCLDMSCSLSFQTICIFFSDLNKCKGFLYLGTIVKVHRLHFWLPFLCCFELKIPGIIVSRLCKLVCLGHTFALEITRLRSISYPFAVSWQK